MIDLLQRHALLALNHESILFFTFYRRHQNTKCAELLKYLLIKNDSRRKAKKKSEKKIPKDFNKRDWMILERASTEGPELTKNLFDTVFS